MKGELCETRKEMGKGKTMLCDEASRVSTSAVLFCISTILHVPSLLFRYSISSKEEPLLVSSHSTISLEGDG